MTPDKRLKPGPRFFERQLAHAPVRAGLPNPALEEGSDLVTIDSYLVKIPSKTTLVRTAMENQRESRVKCIYLNNPLLTRAEFLQFLCLSFGLSKDAESSKTQLIAELTPRLEAFRRRGRAVALLVDEAQSLPDELLEEIRLLTNIEKSDEKLLTLILVGQPELAGRLNDQVLRQLKQRIELRCTLTPFDLPETAAYIASRLSTAGAVIAPFTREAVDVIHQRSRGIPRSISVICENALISGFAEGERPVTSRLVIEVCDDFDLQGLDAFAQVEQKSRAAGADDVAAPDPEAQMTESRARRSPAR
jgi:general secretion pathway protein A